MRTKQVPFVASLCTETVEKPRVQRGREVVTVRKFFVNRVQNWLTCKCASVSDCIKKIIKKTALADNNLENEPLSV